MKVSFFISISFIIIFIVFFIFNKSIEHFIVTTWTPYTIDCYYQPCYTNYFYGNGYMYPIY